VTERVPITPLFDLYKRLHFPKDGRGDGEGVLELRLREARKLLDDPQALVRMFNESLKESEDFFGTFEVTSPRFYPQPRALAEEASIANTKELGRLLGDAKKTPFRVLGDESLNFFYLDRELVATQAPGALLGVDGRVSTADGPRLDLLLAGEKTRRPIVGEVKLTSEGRPDKDGFFALIQALAAAAYLLPRSQFDRLRAHDEDDRLGSHDPQVDVYLLSGEPPESSDYWFDLRDCAEQLGPAIAPFLGEHIGRIAGLELAWLEKDRPGRTRMRITKRFATPDTG
jgi:hypothetical protein